MQKAFINKIAYIIIINIFFIYLEKILQAIFTNMLV